MPHDLEERDGHREDHPHVDHLDVRCRWKRTRDANVAENARFKLIVSKNIAKGTTDPGVDCFDQ